MQDDTRTGVFAGVLAGVAALRRAGVAALLAINPSWYAQTYTGARAEIV